jgi:hypothetical protein
MKSRDQGDFPEFRDFVAFGQQHLLPEDPCIKLTKPRHAE